MHGLPSNARSVEARIDRWRRWTAADSTIQSEAPLGLQAGATQNGKVVDPKGAVTVYYGSRLKDPSKTQPFPLGLRMIAGDAKTQTDTPDKQGNHFWCAGIGGATGRTPDGEYPVCAPTAELVRQRFLLPADAERIVGEAEASDILR